MVGAKFILFKHFEGEMNFYTFLYADFSLRSSVILKYGDFERSKLQNN